MQNCTGSTTTSVLRCCLIVGPGSCHSLKHVRRGKVHDKKTLLTIQKPETSKTCPHHGTPVVFLNSRPVPFKKP